MEKYLSEEQIINFAKGIVPIALKKIFKLGSDEYQKVLVNSELVFSQYLNNSYKKYSKIKTILYRDKPVSLKKHYVQSSFSCANEEIELIRTFDYFSEHKRNIITGTAGAGKSIFMKRFFIDLIENNVGFIPILIELRLLKNNNTYMTIYDYVFNLLSNINPSFTKKQLNYSLKNGKIALLLDGFDEIEESHKTQFEDEILKLSDNYNDIIIILTSRPDPIFQSWEQFHILKANQLEKNEAIELIEKIEYDEELKENFINDLSQNLYDKHKDFTSNPLLLTMMLLTYEQHAKIPEKMHIFYNEAFNTLFNKHDAMKQQFRRKTYSKLPIDEFKKIFSTFCILSFIDNDYTFKKNQILNYIKDSKEFLEIEVDIDLYLKDLLHTVCVIVKDGNSYTFAHRSFQEYFSALFISNNYHWENIYEIIEKVFYKLISSNVIQLLFDLNNNVFEKTYFIKKLKKMQIALNKIDLEKDPYSYLQYFITDLVLEIKHDDKLQYQPRIRTPYVNDEDELENLYKKLYVIEIIAIGELYGISLLPKIGQLLRKYLFPTDIIKLIFNESNINNIKRKRYMYRIKLRSTNFRRNTNNQFNSYLKNNQKIIEGLKEIHNELNLTINKISSKTKIKQSNIKSLFKK